MKVQVISFWSWHSVMGVASSILGAASSSFNQLRFNLKNVHLPDSHATCPTTSGTVIVGGGIIGLSTAYHLAQAIHDAPGPSRPPSRILVVESSDRVCPAASGKSTGGLGSFGFSPETADLGLLSYKIHQGWSQMFSGRAMYDFTPLKIFRITPRDFESELSPLNSWGPDAPVDVPLSALPSWIKPSPDWTAQLLAESPHAAHVNGARLCQFLYQKCKELGVQFAFNSTVAEVKVNKTGQLLSSAKIRRIDKAFQCDFPCTSIVIAAGPWSDHVFEYLFPNAKIQLRMNSTSAAGNHLFVQNPQWHPSHDQQNMTQVFLDNVMPAGKKLDITSWVGGKLYVGGWGAVPEAVPDLAADVLPQMKEIQDMLNVTKGFLNLGIEKEIKLHSADRCYRPLTQYNRPIITKVPWSQLGFRSTRNSPCGGVYINTGHNSDGMTLGPGSGKVMSELLLGQPTSVSISALDL